MHCLACEKYNCQNRHPKLQTEEKTISIATRCWDPNLNACVVSAEKAKSLDCAVRGGFREPGGE